MVYISEIGSTSSDSDTDSRKKNDISINRKAGFKLYQSKSP